MTSAGGGRAFHGPFLHLEKSYQRKGNGGMKSLKDKSRRVWLAGFWSLAVLLLAWPGGVSAKEAAYTCKKFDLDQVPGKDVLTVKEKASGDGYDTGMLTFLVNGKRVGKYDCSADGIYVEGYELVQMKSGDIFLLVSASEGDEYANFLLFQYAKGTFTCCLKGNEVVEARDYLLPSASISYHQKTDELRVWSWNQSQSLGWHRSLIRYLVKDHRIVKKSRIYKVVPLEGHRSRAFAHKTAAYSKATAKKRSFFFQKGEKVKVTKIYDSPKGLRLYATRLSDGKAGWVEGVRNYYGRRLFRGVEFEIP